MDNQYNILNWFFNNHEYNDDSNSIIKIIDLYKEFKSTPYNKSYSKEFKKNIPYFMFKDLLHEAIASKCNKQFFKEVDSRKIIKEIFNKKTVCNIIIRHRRK